MTAADLVLDEHQPTLMETASASFSPDRRYRYALTRTWDPARPVAVFVMLNPSTADAFKVDPTVRRCLTFARSWTCGGLIVLNLFALRSTDPRVLVSSDPDPVGPDNDQVIATTFSVAGPDNIGPVIAAWGGFGRLHDRDQRVLEMLRGRGVDLSCLGTTRSGEPRHPLYIAGNTPARPYPVAAG